MGTRANHVCPICGRDVPPRRGEPTNPSFPFCSPPCKLVDLGQWLDGNYRLPGAPVDHPDAGPRAGVDFTMQAEGLPSRNGDDE